MSLLYSTQQGCPPGIGRQAAGGCGIDSKVKAEWGVGEVSLHQGMTTGPFKDLNMHLTSKLRLWTRVTESHRQPVSGKRSTNTLQRAHPRGVNYGKRCLTSLPSSRDILEEPGSEKEVRAPSLPGGREVIEMRFKLTLRVSRPWEPPYSYLLTSTFEYTQA